MVSQLNLPEQALLLIYDDQKGKSVLDSTYTPAVVSGAAIIDLVINGAMTLVEEDGFLGKKQVLRATGGTHPHHSVMQEVMAKAEGKRPKDAISEIAGLSSFSNLAKRLSGSLLHQMADAGILRIEHGGLMNSERFVSADPAPEQEIRQRVSAALQRMAPPDPMTVGLVAVLNGARALPKVFPEADKKLIQNQAQALVTEADWAGKAIKDAVQEMEMVIYLTIFTSIGVATSS